MVFESCAPDAAEDAEDEYCAVGVDPPLKDEDAVPYVDSTTTQFPEPTLQQSGGNRQKRAVGSARSAAHNLQRSELPSV
ncbi:MAG: hypothetical protein P8J32_08915 [bacterium]|jgi:hypothetical protein|nr:hypothetical protein [bacterium]